MSSNKKKNLIFLIYFQTLITTIVYIFINLNFSYEFYNLVLVLIFFECCFISLIDKIFNIFQLFLMSMFLFNLAIPVFHLLNFYEFPEGNKIFISDGIDLSISNYTLIETYKVLSIFLLSVSLAWLFNLKREVKK